MTKKRAIKLAQELLAEGLGQKAVAIQVAAELDSGTVESAYRRGQQAALAAVRLLKATAASQA